MCRTLKPKLTGIAKGIAKNFSLGLLVHPHAKLSAALSALVFFPGHDAASAIDCLLGASVVMLVLY